MKQLRKLYKMIDDVDKGPTHAIHRDCKVRELFFRRELRWPAPDGLSVDLSLRLGNVNWSVTAQGLFRSDSTTVSGESGLEWLYLTYTPTTNLQIKIGKLRTPFFTMSDFSDVGFAYPWINPPQQVYDTYLFKTFNELFLSNVFENG